MIRDPEKTERSKIKIERTKFVKLIVFKKIILRVHFVFVMAFNTEHTHA